MTIDQLLIRLVEKRHALDIAIAEIRAASAATSTRAKAKAIVESVTRGHGTRGPYKKKKPHWTQTPEGQKKMIAAQKKAWKKRRLNEQQMKEIV